MDLIIEPQKGKPFVIEVGFFDTILEIKQKIQKYHGIAVSDQTLVTLNDGHEKQQTLADDRDVRHYDLLHNSRLSLLSSLRRPDSSTATMRVTVLGKCGTKKIAVDVKLSDNVSELRKELQRLNKSGQIPGLLPPEGDFFFIHKQSVMDDDCSFRWHRVSSGDIIELFNGTVTGGES